MGLHAGPSQSPPRRMRPCRRGRAEPPPALGDVRGSRPAGPAPRGSRQFARAWRGQRASSRRSRSSRPCRSEGRGGLRGGAVLPSPCPGVLRQRAGPPGPRASISASRAATDRPSAPEMASLRATGLRGGAPPPMRPSRRLTQLRRELRLRRAQFRDQRHAALLRGPCPVRRQRRAPIGAEVVDLLEALDDALPGRLDFRELELVRAAPTSGRRRPAQAVVKLRTVCCSVDFVATVSSSFCSLVTSDCSSVATNGVTPLTWPFM